MRQPHHRNSSDHRHATTLRDSSGRTTGSATVQVTGRCSGTQRTHALDRENSSQSDDTYRDASVARSAPHREPAEHTFRDAGGRTSSTVHQRVWRDGADQSAGQRHVRTTGAKR